MVGDRVDDDAASRRTFVYRYNEQRDAMSVWCTNEPDDATAADVLFHELTFEDASEPGVCVARGGHSGPDATSSTEYRFTFKAVSLASFEIKHIVKGPAVDSISDSRYVRG